MRRKSSHSKTSNRKKSDKDKIKTLAIIVAGGSGKRFGSSTPKQFLKLANNPVIYYSIKFFENLRDVDGIVIVSRKDWIKRLEQQISFHRFKKIISVVEGGKERKDSVLCGLQAVKDLDVQVVLIHDAARPFPPKQETAIIIKEALQGNGAILAHPATDTVKETDDKKFIRKTIDRNSIFLAQTPQAFPYNKLLEAYESLNNININFTDEASLFELLKIPVKIIESTWTNMKITEKNDIRIAKEIFKIIK